MSDAPAGGRGLGDWLAIAAAALAAANGVDLLVNSQTPLLRLSVFGLPGWTLWALALIHVAVAAMILSTGLRRYGAVGLVFVAGAALALGIAYREPRDAIVGGGQVLLAFALLATARRRSAAAS